MGAAKCRMCAGTGVVTVTDFTGSEVALCPGCTPACVPDPPDYATIERALRDDPPPAGMAERHAAVARAEHDRLSPTHRVSNDTGGSAAVLICCVAMLFVAGLVIARIVGWL